MADEPLSNDSHSERDPHAAPESDHSAAEHTDYPSSSPSASDPTSELNQPAGYIQPAESSSSDVTSEEDEEGGPVKSFLEHLEDLRWVLIKILVSVLIAMTVCMVAANAISEFLQVPLKRSGANIELTSFNPIGPFMTAMKIAFWGGICLAIPFILWVIAQFVMPALKRNEKPYFRKAFVIGGGLFFIGLIICYWFVLPIALYGSWQFSVWMKVKVVQWDMQQYYNFAVMFMLGMGLSFEIPVLLLTLVRMGIIPHEWMAKGRTYFFIGNLVVSAFITPDAFSTIFMVIPVQLLLEICIQISAHWERQKRKEEAILRDKDK
jgi:sec-independent protein translocase protein TatC